MDNNHVSRAFSPAAQPDPHNTDQPKPKQPEPKLNPIKASDMAAAASDSDAGVDDPGEEKEETVSNVSHGVHSIVAAVVPGASAVSPSPEQKEILLRSLVDLAGAEVVPNATQDLKEAVFCGSGGAGTQPGAGPGAEPATHSVWTESASDGSGDVTRKMPSSLGIPAEYDEVMKQLTRGSITSVQAMYAFAGLLSSPSSDSGQPTPTFMTEAEAEAFGEECAREHYTRHAAAYTAFEAQMAPFFASRKF